MNVDSEATMQGQLVGDQHVWVLLITKPEELEAAPQLVTLWNEVAVKVRLFGVGPAILDVTTPFGASQARDMGLTQTPMVLGFPSVIDIDPARTGSRVNLVPYQGAVNADSIVKWAASLLPESLITVIRTKGELDSFVQAEDSSEGPPAPKALLFTDKRKMSPLLKGLSVHYIYRLSIGLVNVTAAPELSALYDVEKLPTLLVFPPDESDPVRFKGPSLAWQPAMDFFNDHALPELPFDSLRQRMLSALRQKMEADKRRQEAEEERIAQNPTLRIHTTELWQQVLEKGGIQLIAWLDPTAEKHQSYLRVLQKAYARLQRTGTKVPFRWVDGTQQAALAEAFGVAWDFPAVTFLHAKKGWWKLMVGSFSEDRIRNYVADDLLKGNGRPLDISALPRFVYEENPEGLKELETVHNVKTKTSPIPATDAAKIKDAEQDAQVKEAKPDETSQDSGSADDDEIGEAEMEGSSEKKERKGSSAQSARARNKAKEEAKAAQRRANEERRLRAKQERDAKLAAEKAARKSRRPRKTAKPDDSEDYDEL